MGKINICEICSEFYGLDNKTDLKTLKRALRFKTLVSEIYIGKTTQDEYIDIVNEIWESVIMKQGEVVNGEG